MSDRRSSTTRTPVRLSIFAVQRVNIPPAVDRTLAWRPDGLGVELECARRLQPLPRQFPAEGARRTNSETMLHASALKRDLWRQLVSDRNLIDEFELSCAGLIERDQAVNTVVFKRCVGRPYRPPRKVSYDSGVQTFHIDFEVIGPYLPIR